ncbi:MAG TPA: glycosyltransferase family 1 protein [Phycisphaerae bacterium]|nr:glycosyltransferase family 1 protein [Phycisphaerae bacterium]
MHPPRIILNDRCLRGPRTGVGHYVAQLLDHLPNEAPDLEIFPFYRNVLARNRGFSARPTHEKSLDRRPPWRLRRAALNLYNAGFRLAGRLKRCRLYHEPNHIPAPWAGPIVSTFHDLSVLRHPEWHPPDRVRWYDRDLRAGIGRTTHFITVSEFTKREMVDLLGLPAERITVIPLGVRAVFHPRPAEEVRSWLADRGWPTEYFLYAGTIEPRKNVAGLLAGYALLSTFMRRQTSLVLAGVTGWGRQTVNDWIAGHGLVGQVRILGYVDDETLARLYVGARALVWPTLYEGFGLPPLECMACGTPVITSQLASLPEVVGNAGLLVDPRNVRELADAMNRILDDPGLGERLRSEGLDRASRFTWQRCARAHADVYRRMLPNSIIGLQSRVGGASERDTRRLPRTIAPP